MVSRTPGLPTSEPSFAYGGPNVREFMNVGPKVPKYVKIRPDSRIAAYLKISNRTLKYVAGFFSP